MNSRFVHGIALKSRAFATLTTTNATKKQRLIIIGSGWGGFAVMRNVDSAKYDITVISDRNHFLFTPLLSSAAVGALEFRAVAESIRQVRPDVHFHQSVCESVDAQRKQITVRDVFSEKTYTYPFDKLVIASGAQSETFGIQGVKENALFLKSLADARLIRSKLLECLERASNPFLDDVERRALCHIVIVGGGPTAVEVAGELSDFLRTDAPKWFSDIAHLIQVTVIEASGELLAAFDVALGRYARATFRRRHIEVLTEARVTLVEPNRVTIDVHGNKRTMDCGLIVWSTGIGPTPFLKALPFEKKGWKLAVDERLQLVQHPDIFAIGDCSHTGLPATAQAANQEGLFVAKVLNGKLTDGDGAFRYRHMFALAYIGGYKALIDTGNRQARGFLSFLVWRAAYWTTSVSWRNKILIPMYWAKTFVFGRDLTRF